MEKYEAIVSGNTKVQLIRYDSREFRQAARLRYKLFFAEHNLPWNIVHDRDRSNYFHAAILIRDEVVAYGQLVPHDDRVYRVCQMVVAPEYQGQKLGSKILLFLIDTAKQEGAIALTLNARLTAVGFYQKFGFQTQGIQFPSSTTGVPHITMKKKLVET